MEKTEFVRYEYQVSHEVSWRADDEPDIPWEEYKRNNPDPQVAFDEIIMGENGYEEAELVKMWIVEGYSWYKDGEYKEEVTSRTEYPPQPIEEANEVLTTEEVRYTEDMSYDNCMLCKEKFRVGDRVVELDVYGIEHSSCHDEKE